MRIIHTACHSSCKNFTSYQLRYIAFPILHISCLFNDGLLTRLSWCLIVVLIFIFLITSDYFWISFHISIGLYIASLEKYLQTFCPFLSGLFVLGFVFNFLLLICIQSFGCSPLIQIYDLHIWLFYSLDCLFTLLVVTFTVQKLLVLM